MTLLFHQEKSYSGGAFIYSLNSMFPSLHKATSHRARGTDCHLLETLRAQWMTWFVFILFLLLLLLIWAEWLPFHDLYLIHIISSEEEAPRVLLLLSLNPIITSKQHALLLLLLMITQRSSQHAPNWRTIDDDRSLIAIIWFLQTTQTQIQFYEYFRVF